MLLYVLSTDNTAETSDSKEKLVKALTPVRKIVNTNRRLHLKSS